MKEAQRKKKKVEEFLKTSCHSFKLHLLCFSNLQYPL